jgi:hypothetical protein
MRKVKSVRKTTYTDTGPLGLSHRTRYVTTYTNGDRKVTNTRGLGSGGETWGETFLGLGILLMVLVAIPFLVAFLLGLPVAILLRKGHAYLDWWNLKLSPLSRLLSPKRP